MPHGEKWTDERVTLLRELWFKVSALDISDQLNKITSEAGSLTRNAVIGKALRLKLGAKVGGRPKSQKAKPPPPPPSPPPLLPSLVVMAAPFPEAAPPQPESRTFWTLKGDEDACRWPCGEEPLNDGYFCGAPAIESRPYCEEHSRKAYVSKKGASNAAKNLPNWRLRTNARGV